MAHLNNLSDIFVLINNAETFSIQGGKTPNVSMLFLLYFNILILYYEFMVFSDR